MGEIKMKKRISALLCVILSACLLFSGSALADTKVTVTNPDGNGQVVTVDVDGSVTGDHDGSSEEGIEIDGSRVDFLYIDGKDLSNELSSVDNPLSVSVTADSVSEKTVNDMDACGANVYTGSQLSADITVNGDVTAQAENADTASSHGMVIIAADGKEAGAEVSGDISVTAKGGNNADAAGMNVSANAGGKTTVTVGGDVAAVSESGTRQVSSFGIEGEATGNGSELKVTVGGDVSGKGTDGNGNAVGYGLNLKNEPGATTDIVVGGTVEGDTAAVRLQFTGQDDPDAISLTAWKVEENEKDKLVEAAGIFQNTEEQIKAETAFEERINYIVRVQDKVSKLLTAAGGGTVSLDGKTYATAVEGEDVALTVSLGDGVALDGVYYDADNEKTLTKTDSLGKDQDGKYVLKMNRGGGMLLGLASHTHSGPATVENRVEPTCLKAGSYDSVVRCSVCSTEISRKTVPLDKLAHTEETIVENRVEPTCETAGSYDTVVKCSVCGKELSRTTVTLDPPGHTEETIEKKRVEPTCTTEGSCYKVVKCSVCGETLRRTKVTLPPTGHGKTTVEEKRAEPACEQAGYYEKAVKCTVCGEVIDRERITLNALTHQLYSTEENRVEPTCEQAGYYDEVVRCSLCGEKISGKRVTLAPTGHTPQEWRSNIKKSTETEEGGYDVISVCSVCKQYLGQRHVTTPVTGKRDITVHIVWVDNNNADGNRPERVTVRLYANGAEVDSAVTDSECTFAGKPERDKNGQTIKYTLSLDSAEMYAESFNGFTIVMTYEPELTAKSVSVVWDDDNNVEGRRPLSVAAELLAGGKVVNTLILNDLNGWTGSAYNLPTVLNGKEAEYRFRIQTVLSYTQDKTEQMGGLYIFTLKRWERPEKPSPGAHPKVVGDVFYVFEDVDGPL